VSDLADLPLKSLELPSKTVAKLKPLKIATVADLYKHSAAALAAAGLVLRELEEIAEAASEFGVTWSSKAEVRAALGAPATAAPAKKPAALKSPAAPVKAARITLPADVLEAFSTPPAHASLSDADLDCFAPYVDASRRNFRTPPVSPRHLRLVRRLALVSDASIGGSASRYLVGVIDLSGFPVARANELPTFLMHVANLLDDVLKRIGVTRTAQSQVGSAVQLGIAAKDAGKVLALVEAHQRWIGDAPPFGAPVPPALRPIADAGLGALH